MGGTRAVRVHSVNNLPKQEVVKCARCGNIVPYPETRCRVCRHEPFGTKARRDYLSALQLLACASIMGGMVLLFFSLALTIIANMEAGVVAGVGLMNFGALLAIFDRLSELVWRKRD